MKSNYKKRWVLVGIIWSFVLIVFSYNFIKIKSYLKEKEKITIQKKIQEFIKENESVLKNVFQEKKRIYDYVPSQRIGLIKAEEILNIVANENSLEAEQIEHGESNDLSLICRGTVRDLIKAIDYIYSHYPYLEIFSIELELNEYATEGRFKIQLKYNFELSSE